MQKKWVGRASLPAIIALLFVLVLSSYTSVYAWSSSPQVTSAVDSSGNTILSLTFNFDDMAYPDRMAADGRNHGFSWGYSGHYPTAFQVRTSTDRVSWTAYDPVPLSLGPRPHEPYEVPVIVTVSYNLGTVHGTLWVQARLQDNVVGWSAWEPKPPISLP